MKIWKREGYTVKEKEFDFDLHEFDVIKNNEVIVTITPDSLQTMQEIIVDLNRGDSVDGWEDGKGNTIHVREDGKGNTIHVRAELTERILEIIEELGELPMEGIGDLEGLMKELVARGYACSISADTNYLEVSKEDYHK